MSDVIAQFRAALYANGKEYDSASIEARNVDDAVRKAKDWVKTIELRKNSSLEITLDGRHVRTFKHKEL